jgi:hypothetical protein
MLKSPAIAGLFFLQAQHQFLYCTLWGYAYPQVWLNFRENYLPESFSFCILLCPLCGGNYRAVWLVFYVVL